MSRLETVVPPVKCSMAAACMFLVNAVDAWMPGIRTQHTEKEGMQYVNQENSST